MKKLSLALFFLICLGTVANAGLWDEPVNGDLSGDNFAPTALTFDLGVNRVKGTMGGDPGDGIPLDRDIFKVTIASGQRISSIEVLTFAPTGLSFYAVAAGESISITSSANHLSNTLISSTGEILPTLASGAYNGGTGLTDPIPAGTYTFWLQEVSSVVTYEMAYTVQAVPEPGSVSLLLLGLLALGAWRRVGRAAY
ncbi:MAG: PEP-CTERM sorting domain-containing protein [Terrimicrobiaceae bacterium]